MLLVRLTVSPKPGDHVHTAVAAQLESSSWPQDDAWERPACWKHVEGEDRKGDRPAFHHRAAFH